MLLFSNPAKNPKETPRIFQCISIYLQQTSYFALSNLIFLGIRNHVSSTHSLQEVPFRSSVRFGVKTLSSLIPLWLSQWQAWTGSEMLGDSVILWRDLGCVTVFIYVYIDVGLIILDFKGPWLFQKGSDVVESTVWSGGKCSQMPLELDKSSFVPQRSFHRSFLFVVYCNKCFPQYRIK